jgi:nucleoside-diphosphate kinase
LERTLVLIKPDAIQRGLTGAILARREARGLKIAGLRMLHMDEALAKRHYEAHVERPFFRGLVEFITSGPLVAVVLEGRNAIDVVRNTMGATDSAKAAPGTIRGDWGVDIGRNLIHGSDSAEAAAREIQIFFGDGGLITYARAVDPWITESP